jgi:cell division protein FtsW
MENTGQNGAGTPKKGLWRFIDNIEGDKVIWIIVLLLILISVLAIFSSTPLLSNESRIEIMKGHGRVALAGFALIFLLYRFVTKIGIYRFFARYGFALSLILLLVLVSGQDFGFIKSQEINGARRTLELFGVQIHVFEIVKIAMVMYMSWALHAHKQDSEAMRNGTESPTFKTANRLAERKELEFLRHPFWKRVFYIYAPALITCVLVVTGSSSSAILIGIVLIGTMLIGGVPIRELVLAGGAMLAVAVVLLCIHEATDGKFIGRLSTFKSRIGATYDTSVLEKYKKDSKDFYEALDDIRQPYGAKVALHEGGLLGKGSGNSTQKYSVTHIYSDYMYSFLVEEYGLVGGIIIIILYLSLIARTSMIARLCGNEFAKIAIGGLAFLITSQAFLHILVNVGIFPMTGQTLPLLSDGASAFLMSCLAFGIILSISRMAKKKMKSVEESELSITDDIQARITVLEDIDNDIQL